MLEVPQNENVENKTTDNTDIEIEDYLTKNKNSLNTAELSDTPFKNKKKIIAAVVVVFLALLVFGYSSLIKGHSSFAKENVRVSIDTPDQIGSGEEASITINCENKNQVVLKDAKLEIFFPDNFIMKSSDQKIEQSGNAYYWNVGDINALSTGKIRIYGKVIGKLGEDRPINALLRYKPANFNSDFQAEGAKNIKITSVPVELKLNFPESVKDSSEAEFTFVYKNTSRRDFGKVRLETEFPNNFIYASSDPGMNKKDGDGNIYALEGDSFSKGSEKSVKVKGTFQSQSEKETVKARIYLLEENNQMVEYDAQEKDIKMEKTEVLLSQTINGFSDYSAGSGEELNYKITFKNQSSNDISGMVLKSNLEGSYDLATLRAGKASVSGGSISWNASNTPELAALKAGSEGSVEFKVKVKDVGANIQKESDKNFVLKNTAIISNMGGGSTTEKVIAKNEFNSKLKALLVLDTKGYFNDDGRISNGGALPPQVGQKTFYTMHWSLRNSFNDVENIRVSTVLPAGVKWTGRYIDSQGKTKSDDSIGSAQPTGSDNPDANKITEEKVYYDTNTNSVVWVTPKLKANAGVLTPAKEVVFQIEATPGENSIGLSMMLIDNAAVSAFDTFIQNNISSSYDKKITTQLTDDFSIGDQEAIVKG